MPCVTVASDHLKLSHPLGVMEWSSAPNYPGKDEIALGTEYTKKLTIFTSLNIYKPVSLSQNLRLVLKWQSTLS